MIEVAIGLALVFALVSLLVSAAQEVAEREQTLAQKLAQQRKTREAQLPMMAGIGHERPKPALKPAKSWEKKLGIS